MYIFNSLELWVYMLLKNKKSSLKNYGDKNIGILTKYRKNLFQFKKFIIGILLNYTLIKIPAKVPKNKLLPK